MNNQSQTTLICLLFNWMEPPTREESPPYQHQDLLANLVDKTAAIKNIQKALTAIIPTKSKRSLSENPRHCPTPKPMLKEAKEKSARSKCFTHDCN